MEKMELQGTPPLRSEDVRTTRKKGRKEASPGIRSFQRLLKERIKTSPEGPHVPVFPRTTFPPTVVTKIPRTKLF